ncbi:serine/threonine protein kinase with Chase2 sensor [gamma proteobacterium HTCC5015]|nr:serine/threonine protein kinase with Chase2 sensor [gamma proteobacterium HTCC5015]
MKSNFWKRDWFTALVIVLFVCLFRQFFQGIEMAAYDWGVRSANADPSDQVAVVAIDENSIANIGRWPWPRAQQAEIINYLSQGNPDTIAYLPLFSEAQVDPGQSYISALLNFFEQSSLNELSLLNAESAMSEEAALEGDTSLANGAPESSLSSDEQDLLAFPLVRQAAQDAEQMLITLYEAEQALDADLQLSSAFEAANNVVTPLLFTRMGSQFQNNKSATPMPESVAAQALSKPVDRINAAQNGLLPPLAVEAALPIAAYRDSAVGLGHINTWQDPSDGVVRSDQLVIQYGDAFYPSYALAIASAYLELQPKDLQIQLGEGLKLGNLFIGTDPRLRMRNFYYSGDNGNAFSVDSLYDLIAGHVPVDKYEGKIVLVGPTAAGVGSSQVTPISSITSPVLMLAHTVSSILQEDFYTQPAWAPLASFGVLLLAALYLMLALPRLKAFTGALVTGGLVLGIVASHHLALTQGRLWIELMLPVCLLLIGYLILTTKRFLVTERGKMRSDLDNAETNRMLGLAFQGQGQLDMAFEKFRKCPMDNSLMEVLYNLALDYERKRQFAKAVNVYQHIADHDAQFRDVQQRLDRGKKMEETIVLGGGSGGGAAATMMMEGDGVQKPMLGRYEIQKELGKGAMGVVYLGEDPKISRTVAIKTMALSQEFDEDELDDVKARFFREAETAGRLNHPNIVTIYDAGDEHDLAYIAMEFLSGKDLVPYTKQGQLLPLATSLDIVAQCADALNYAHGHNVVHRDIKPANIMYDPEKGSVKVTDFGIARITDASKTKTGVVLGTPSYMSPEQLAGKKVDGRSDLFSLGVMLYQMAVGELPFKADSMATLMFKIANDPTPDPRSVDSNLPQDVADIIAKALEKDPDQRYASGADMVADLRQSLASLS